MRLFDIFKNHSISYTGVENESLRAISTRFRGSNEDTVFVTTSRLCPECSKYNRRIFSLYGRYKSFPLLPTFLTKSRCPECGICIGFAHYFPGITGNLKKDIKFNQQPLVDRRTKEERKLWEENVLRQEQIRKMEQDYKWIVQNLPELAPKSVGGYKRMCKSNSINFQKIVKLAKEKGYQI